MNDFQKDSRAHPRPHSTSPTLSTLQSASPASPSSSHYQSPPPPPRFRAPGPADCPQSPGPPPRSAAKSPASVLPHPPAHLSTHARHHRHFQRADRKFAHTESPHRRDPAAKS